MQVRKVFCQAPLFAGLLALNALPASAAIQRTVENGKTLRVDNTTADAGYVVEDGATLNVLNGGVAGNGRPDNQVMNARVNAGAGSRLTGLWAINSGGRLTMGGDGPVARLEGNVRIEYAAAAALDNVTVNASGDAFYLRGGALTTTARTRIIASDTGVLTGSMERDSVIRINGSEVTGGYAGIYLNGIDGTVTLNHATVTGGLAALVIHQGKNAVAVHGSSLLSTGKERLSADYGHPDARSGAILIHLSGLNRKGEQDFTVDSGSLIRDLASDGVGIYVMNDPLTPVTGTVSRSDIYGGRYGIFVGADTFSAPGSGTTSLTLDQSRVSGKNGAAIRVQDGSALDVQLRNGTQLDGKDGTLASVGKGSQLRFSVARTSLFGNLLNNEGGSAVVTLKADSALTGVMQNVNQLTTASGAVWQLTGDSSVGSISNAGRISLSDGVSPGHVLTVSGNYAGHDGDLFFGSQLGGDASVTDRLLVKGNTSGNTFVTVRNMGGRGARTLDGIELIHVNGVSQGEFSQKGRIVAGAYDYSLRRRGKNWYLDSFIPNPNPDIHILRPEVGSYIANQAAASMFLTTLHDREGGERGRVTGGEGESSLWLREQGARGHFRDGSGQLHTRGHTWVTQLGGEVAQWRISGSDRVRVGVMAGYGGNRNHTGSGVSGYGSEGTVTGYSAGVYGTWYQNDAEGTGAYADGQVLYNWLHNTVKGEGAGTTKYRTEGLLTSLEGGYRLKVGESGTPDNPVSYFVEPQSQVTWMGMKGEAFREANGTGVRVEGEGNVQTRLGIRAIARGRSARDRGTERQFEPYVEVNWLHDTTRAGVSLNGEKDEQAGGKSVGELKVGLEARLTESVGLWGNVGERLGGEGYRSADGRLGVKYRF